MEQKRIRWNGWGEYKKEIMSRRFAVTVLFLLTLMTSMANGTSAIMKDYDVKIAPWMLPHYMSSYIFAAVYGFIICYAFSNVPFMMKSELYGIIRKGRMIWCTEKIFAILLEALTIALTMVVLSVIVFIPYVGYEPGWGKVIQTLAFGIGKYNGIYGLAFGSIIKNYTPVQAMLVSFLMLWLVNSLVGLLMFAVSMYVSRKAAVVTGLLLSGITYMHYSIRFLDHIYFASPITWLRIGIYNHHEFTDFIYPGFEDYRKAGLIAMGVITVLILVKAGRLQFDFYNEE